MDTHESFDRGEVKASSDRSFGLVFAAVFAIVAFWPLMSGGGARPWAFALAAFFVATAVVRPRLLRPLSRAWFKIGLILHHVMTPIVMGVIFVLGVLPTAVCECAERIPCGSIRAGAARPIGSYARRRGLRPTP
jgi:predicted membrane metal-binding protein